MKTLRVLAIVTVILGLVGLVSIAQADGRRDYGDRHSRLGKPWIGVVKKGGGDRALVRRDRETVSVRLNLRKGRLYKGDRIRLVPIRRTTHDEIAEVYHGAAVHIVAQLCPPDFPAFDFRSQCRLTDPQERAGLLKCQQVRQPDLDT